MSGEQPIPLARPEVGDREIELVSEVIRSGALSLGPMLERFERGLAARLGVDDAIAVSSGTAALHLCVRRLGWGAGDRVLTTPLSFVASSNCLLYEGVEPVFCDVEPDSLNIDPEAASAAVDERTAGILAVHIFGHAADMPDLEALAGKRGLALLEDACQALGALDSEGREVGSRGNLATFAFYGNKQLTTGEGGLVVPRDEADAALIRSERNQGRAPDMGWLDHERLGFNYRLSDVAAAIGVAQLERLDELLEARRSIAAAYDARLDELERVSAPAAVPAPGGRSWFVYTVRLDADVDRDAVIRALADHGVQSKGYLPCIHLYPFYRERFGYGPGDFPVAEDFARRSLALPLYPSMTEAEVERVVAALAGALGA